MSALLRLFGPLMYVAALVLVTKRRKLTRALTNAGATAPDRAIPLETSGLSEWWLARLTAAGVIHPTSSGLYWLDPVAYKSYRRVRMVRAAVVAGLAFGAWLVWWMTLCCRS